MEDAADQYDVQRHDRQRISVESLLSDTREKIVNLGGCGHCVEPLQIHHLNGSHFGKGAALDQVRALRVHLDGIRLAHHWGLGLVTRQRSAALPVLRLFLPHLVSDLLLAFPRDRGRRAGIRVVTALAAFEASHVCRNWL